ncbi:MAG: hypothetical protein ABUK01_03725 [Leptospirales bacterium]
MENEFDIFDNNSTDNNDGNDGKKIDDAGIYFTLNLAYAPLQNSIYLPDYKSNPLDPWLYTAFFQYKKYFEIGKTGGLNVSLGMHNTNKNRNITMQLLRGYGAAGIFENSMPGFSNNVSFTKFMLYELSGDFNIKDKVFMEVGVLPLLQGNSFYKNPVSFFERYFSNRQYFQEYTAFSSPGLSVEFAGDLFSGKLLYTPAMSTAHTQNTASEYSYNLTDYLGYTIDEHVLMFKNSFHVSPVFADIYFFSSTTNTNNPFYFGAGTEVVWNITNSLGISGQFIYSNGIETNHVVKNSSGGENYYSVEPLPGSTDKYYPESFLSVAFSGIRNYEISLSYYYNGRGFSDQQYNKVIQGLHTAKKGLNSSNAVVSLASQNYYYDILGIYDPFAMTRNYIFLNITNVKDLDIWTWGITPFFSVKDFSFMLTGYANWIINSSMTIYVQTTWNIGSPETVFGESLFQKNITGGVEWKF